jgi:hypothetical protein
LPFFPLVVDNASSAVSTLLLLVVLPLLVLDTGFSGISSSPSLTGRAAAFRLPFALEVAVTEVAARGGTSSSVAAAEAELIRSDLDAVVGRELNFETVSAGGIEAHR